MWAGSLTALGLCVVTALLLSGAHAQCTLQPPALSDAQLTSICASGTAFSSPACSIHRLCFNTAVTPAMFPQLCNSTRVASSLCLDDTEIVAAIPQCASFAAARSTALSSTCVQALGIFSILSTQATRASAANACDTMGNPDSMEGCGVCQLASCPDPLVALGQGCADMDMGQCAQMATFCNTDANIGKYGAAAAAVCLLPRQRGGITAPPRPPPAAIAAPAPSPPPPSPSPSPPPVSSPPVAQPVQSPPVAQPVQSPPPEVAATPSPAQVGVAASSPPPALAQDDCITNPTAASCVSYRYPTASINADIGKMCKSMPDMPGCSISKACTDGKVDTNGRWCAPMTLLATLCVDMPTMAGCRTYKQLCSTQGSVVKQCTEYPAIPRTPTTDSSRQEIFSICEEMTMTQCTQCNRTSCPSPLDTLVGLCADMPTMRQCEGVDSWCSAVGSGLEFYCTAGGSESSGLPSMLMYFHQRYEEIVLWRQWIPRTQGQYVGTIFCILSFGVISMFLKALTSVLSIIWRHPSTRQAPPACWWLPARYQLSHNVIKGSLMAVATCIDYFNMLVAMTFNIGLFVAVVMSYALGTLLVAHIPDNFSAHLASQRAEEAQRQRAALLDAKMEAGEGQGVGLGSSSSSTVSPHSSTAAHVMAGEEHPACCPSPL